MLPDGYIGVAGFRRMFRFVRTCGARSRGTETRTRDLLVPNQARYQLRYTPTAGTNSLLTRRLNTSPPL